MKTTRPLKFFLAFMAWGLSWACYAGPNQTNAPIRAVSLDYCADQFTLALLPKSQIAAVSIDADKSYSYMRAAAKDLPQVRASAENVLAFEPNLVVRSYGGGANAGAFYEGLGITVVQLNYTNTIAGAQKEILRIAERLNAPATGAALVKDMSTRLAQLKGHPANQPETSSVMYMTPGGVTSGKHTMMDELISAAGLKNFEQRAGWHPLPLEALTLRQPELVAVAFNDGDHQHYWSAARHSVLRQQLQQSKTIQLDDATTACGGWFLMDAIERLYEGAGT
ncbi:MAG: ABC transporter substrate-binding protein [Pseudomonadales bacterium]